MANYANIKATIDTQIKQNGNEEITGPVLNSVLNAMVTTIGAGYQYAGVATPSTNPGSPDNRVFYIAATAGTYTNMGGLVVSDGEVAILKYNGTWTKDVTGVANAEQVSQLSQKVAEIGDKSPITFESGYYYIAGAVVGQTFTGSPQPSSSYTRSKMACSEGDTFLLNIVTGSGSGAIAFTDSDNILLSKVGGTISYTNELVVAPANAAYIYINDKSGNVSYKLGKLGLLENSVNELEDSVAELQEASSALVTPEDCSFFNVNLFNPDDENVEIGKYLSSRTGGTATNVNFLITGFIPISEESNKLIASIDGNYGGGGGFWCLYDQNKVALGVGAQMYSTSGIATWREGAHYVRFSISGYARGNVKVEYGENVTQYVKYGSAQLKPSFVPTFNNTYVTGKLSSMASGESIVLTNNKVKSFKRLSFTADITTFGTLLIGHGRNTYAASWLEINGTNIICHNYLTSDATSTKAHGLTFANNVQVVIEQDAEESCKVRLATNGASYNTEFEWRGSNGDIFAESSGSTLTNVVFSWTANGLSQKIWGFGDSYFSLSSDQRWTYYLLSDSHKDWLMDAVPGGSSSGSKTDLNNLSKIGLPKKLFWAMGMNDPDTPTAVNSAWNTAYSAVVAFCKANNVELILATIPSVAGGPVEDSDVPATLRRHQFKNAIVRNSGYRYVDFDKAVGANEETGQWYSGMLSSDGVHPTAAGAIALYMQAVADFPELMTT